MSAARTIALLALCLLALPPATIAVLALYAITRATGGHTHD